MAIWSRLHGQKYSISCPFFYRIFRDTIGKLLKINILSKCDTKAQVTIGVRFYSETRY